MAGPVRRWLFTWEESLLWINGANYAKDAP